MGIRIIAPPMRVLLTTEKNDQKNPSIYACFVYNAGLNGITGTFESSGPPKTEFYYQYVQNAVKKDGDAYEALDVLADRVKVLGIFSDRGATDIYFASYMGL